LIIDRSGLSDSYQEYAFVSGNSDSANVDIRLALSGTTTLLIIALLVFMVHRLRQRRLLIIMRRMAFDMFTLSAFLVFSAELKLA
jgi:hypothetical protein